MRRLQNAITRLIAKSAYLSAVVVWVAIKTGRMSAPEFRAILKDMGRI